MSTKRIEYAAGHSGKTLAVRILPGSDLISSIEKACKENNIKHAYVTCFGSLSKATYLYLVPKNDAKIGAGYGNPAIQDGPVEFLNGTGVVCQNNGNYDTHFHATMCDKTGTVFGGHIIKDENPVLTTVDVIIIEVVGMDMLRGFDEETELTQFQPKQ